MVGKAAAMASRPRFQSAQIHFEVAFGNVYPESMSGCIHSNVMVAVDALADGSATEACMVSLMTRIRFQMSSFREPGFNLRRSFKLKRGQVLPGSLSPSVLRDMPFFDGKTKIQARTFQSAEMSEFQANAPVVPTREEFERCSGLESPRSGAVSECTR